MIYIVILFLSKVSYEKQIYYHEKIIYAKFDVLMTYVYI